MTKREAIRAGEVAAWGEITPRGTPCRIVARLICYLRSQVSFEVISIECDDETVKGLVGEEIRRTYSELIKGNVCKLKNHPASQGATVSAKPPQVKRPPAGALVSGFNNRPTTTRKPTGVLKNAFNQRSTIARQPHMRPDHPQIE